MDLKDVATISGKSGLFRILKPTRAGVILETIDEQKTKIVAGANNRVSILKEISVYTLNEAGSIPLEDVLMSIYKEYKGEVPLDSKSSNDELKSFISKVVPEYDEDRVYVSDIKKMVGWYNLIYKSMPEQFTETAPAAEEADSEATEVKETKKAKAPAASKEKDNSSEEEKEAKPKKAKAAKKE
jgi:hypothetical protein